jgi:hypothetical protein
MTVPSTTDPTRELLAVRLARIMGALGPVAKKGKVTSQGSGPTYKFARDADVLEAVIPEMAKEGIILVPEHTELLSMGPNLRETQLLANIRTDWHVTDGVESIRFETFGQGQDSGDKALPKAQTNSRKYALFMLYHIVTGDDPDVHASEPIEQSGRGARPSRDTGPAPAPAPYRRSELVALMAEKAMDLAGVEQYADLVGIPKDERPMSDASMDALIEAVRGHGSDTPLELPLGGAEPPAEAPKAEDMPADAAIAAGAALVAKS